MKSVIWLILHNLIVSTVICQEAPLMQVVNAEKQFAAYAKSNGTAPAFMIFLDDSSKVFDKGKILNGKEFWQQRKADSSELSWYPEFADISASGDLGYTSGPWEYRVKKGSEKADFRGYFNSIWKKNDMGEWKVLIDLGVPAPESEYDEEKVEYVSSAIDEKTAPVRKKNSKDAKRRTNKTEEIADLEGKFIANYADGKAYMKYASPKARFFRPMKKVMKGTVTLPDTVKYTYRYAAGGMAPSKDLAYAFGYVTSLGKEGNYLRVWKKEGGEWKILLDVATI
jgi:ketosteroid isomerase-like protein